MYRFNCQFSDELGERLADYSEKMGMSKVAVVTIALSEYLNTAEVKQKLLSQLGDPMQFAEMCKAMGVTPEALKKL